jgi:hypothetical protein
LPAPSAWTGQHSIGCKRPSLRSWRTGAPSAFAVKRRYTGGIIQATMPAPASRPTAKTSVPIITRVGRLAMVRLAGTGHLAGIARVPAPAAQISPRNGRGRSPSRQPGSPTKA